MKQNQARQLRYGLQHNIWSKDFRKDCSHDVPLCGDFGLIIIDILEERI